MKTIYTVVEGEGSVEVCINLTRPKEDIGDEKVFVEAYDYRRSVYIPAGAVLAGKSSFQLVHSMTLVHIFQNLTVLIHALECMR